ncbi:hypothetical protein, partial [Aeromonas sp. QDB51]|uniref:hypothetical protein n=1 Tax=Aeromonas sp. QDB51 TaxID=2989827 RepID=UPI0022E463B7
EDAINAGRKKVIGMMLLADRHDVISHEVRLIAMARKSASFHRKKSGSAIKELSSPYTVCASPSSPRWP